MVPRCGYYVLGDVIICETVYIEWNKGFDRAAKTAYTYDLLNKLDHLKPVAEVTTASPNVETRGLSPMYIKMKDNQQLSVEDYMKDLHDRVPSSRGQMCFFHLTYLQNLLKEHIRTLHKYNCYTDVFANPAKGFGHSQALSLAIYRLLENTKRLHLLSNNQAFIKWYNDDLMNSVVHMGGAYER